MDAYRVDQDAMQALDAMAVGGHGWVLPRPDGSKANCGGPMMCRECSLESALLRVQDRVVIWEGFNLKPGDRLLLIAPPATDKEAIEWMTERMKGRLPEVHVTIVAGFTGVQVHNQEPTVDKRH